MRLSTLRKSGPGSLKRYLSFGGGGYTAPNFWLGDDKASLFSSMRNAVGQHEEIGSSFDDYVEHAYKANGIVFACILARMLPFSEARFQMQRLTDGRPGDLFDHASLRRLDNPWPNADTGELLARMEQDVSLAGNFYAATVGDHLRRLRPDWVTIVTGVPGESNGDWWDLNAEVLGYIYHPKPAGVPRPDPVLLSPARVAHWSPIPDPQAQWRGMSWLTPILREIDGDTAAMKHKLKFFQNGATASMAVSYPEDMPVDLFKQYVQLFKEAHDGVNNAYKTIHFGSGATPVTVGTDLKQLDFKVTQGHGETRIAAAAGVGAIIARFSEGMQGSSLNQGNYGAAKRQFADQTLRPNWRGAANALSRLVTVPAGARLWYDDRDIAFLKEDAKDEADIFKIDAETIRTLTDGGYDPASVVEAVQARNASLLNHTGKLSVQLQNMNGDDTAAADVAHARDIAEIVQKIYLGVVNDLITAEEGRQILNSAGAGLTGPAPTD